MAFLSLYTSNSHAAVAPVTKPIKDFLLIDQMTNGGSGCRQGSLVGKGKVATAKQLEFKLDSFKTATGGSDVFDRKNCTLSFPFVAPKGLKLVVHQITAEGSSELPAGTKADFSIDIFKAGQPGNRIEMPIPAQRWGLKLTSQPKVAFESECGDQGILRVNTAVFLKSTQTRDMARVDLQEITIHADLEACK